MADPTDNDSKEKTRDGEAENNISKQNANTDENAGKSTEDEGSRRNASSGGGNNDIPNNDNSSGQDDNQDRSTREFQNLLNL